MTNYIEQYTEHQKDKKMQSVDLTQTEFIHCII